MKENYDVCLARVLRDEGGYTNHPRDPGGPTNFGITIHDYRQYVNPNATAQDIKNMKLSEAKQIYRARYWDALHCDDLPSGVDYAVFDYGVNSGIGRSGPTYHRLNHGQDPLTLSNAIWDERLAFLKRLSTWPTFGRGWERRCIEGKQFSAQLATGKKPVPPKAKPPVGPIVVGGGAVAASHVSLYLALGIVAVAIIGGLLFYYYKKRKEHVAKAYESVPEIRDVDQQLGSQG